MADEEMFSWLLFKQGTLGLTIENIDEHTLSIGASFHPQDLSKDNIAELLRQLKKAGLEQAASTLKINNIPNEDWMTNWKKHFIPFTIGDSLLICPPWKEKSIANKEYESLTKIIIDPGMAFGTGLHATTSFCLEAIEHFVQGPNILDVGTGSGILAISCALLFPALNIVAIDNDENSTTNAQHNIDLNKVTKQITLEQIDLKAFQSQTKTQFNTILSNLTAEVIIEFLPKYDKLLASSGHLILAGIIEERLPLIEAALSKYPLKQIKKTIDRGWVGLVLTRA